MSQQKSFLAVLFTDMCNSTRLYEKYGDEKALAIVDRTMAVLTEQVTAYRGMVLKTIGDEIMCTFPDSKNAIESASALHKAIEEDSFLSKFNISVKTGLHSGDVITDGKDVFGDTVNIAARMVSLAKADQIIATGVSTAGLPLELRMNTRGLGSVKVHGKKEEIDIVEVIWQEDFSDLTIMPGMTNSENKKNSSVVLVLDYNGKKFENPGDDSTLNLGRSEKNQIVVKNKMVSRNHASTKYRKGNFILADHSTNGTFIKNNRGEISFIHREEIRLSHGGGYISLGQKFSKAGDDIIRYSILGSSILGSNLYS